MKVIGPAVAEKLAHVPKRKKDTAPPPRLNKLQWQKLQTLITQAEGGMTVALETDARPALPMSAEGFVDVTDAVDDCSDLLS
jgi:bifunctional ADP-heptose synthase (sugar kinase/adenylyltransferase)